MSDGTGDPVATTFALDARPFAFWREHICDELLNADCPARAVSLGGKLDLTQVRGVVAMDMHVRVPGLGIGRTIGRIAQESRPEAFGLTYVMRGTCTVETEGREFVLRAGDVCLLSSGQPFTKLLGGEEYREHFLYLPVPTMAALNGRRLPDPKRNVAPAHGLGSLLADTLSSLARRRSELRREDWPPLLNALLQMSEATFGGTLDDEVRDRTRPAARHLQRERVLRYIDEHLAAPDLTPTRLASALGMSPRYLHLLFEDADHSVGGTILARRLDRCREALADPRVSHLQIGEIAYAHGFNDTAHFSRAFKVRFGVRPRDVRASPRARDGEAMSRSRPAG